MAGHGHVIPNADGWLVRCGGPALCSACALELAALNQSPPTAKPKKQRWTSVECGCGVWFPQDSENPELVCYDCRAGAAPKPPQDRTTCALCQLTHTEGRTIPIERRGLANSSWLCEQCLATLAEWFLAAWRH